METNSHFSSSWYWDLNRGLLLSPLKPSLHVTHYLRNLIEGVPSVRVLIKLRAASLTPPAPILHPSCCSLLSASAQWRPQIWYKYLNDPSQESDIDLIIKMHPAERVTHIVCSSVFEIAVSSSQNIISKFWISNHWLFLIKWVMSKPITHGSGG